MPSRSSGSKPKVDEKQEVDETAGDKDTAASLVPNLYREALSASPSLQIKSTLLESGERSRKFALELSDSEGRVFNLYVREPIPTPLSMPAIVILAGFETGRASLDLVEERDGILLLSMDYPDHGTDNMRSLKSLADLGTLQKIAADTVRGTFYAVSYLESRPDVDRARTVLLGVSFGGFPAVVAGANDPRVDGVVLIYGGGDYEAISRKNLSGTKWVPVSVIAKGVIAILKGFEPFDHVAKIAPRPFIMINSKVDDYFPMSSMQGLFDLAAEPKELRWYDTKHMALFDPSLLREITNNVLGRLQFYGLLNKETSSK